GELQATPLQQAELAQGITFYLTGSLTQFESQLINPEFLGERRETCYRHLARLMAQYNWSLPLTRGLFDSLELQTKVFFDKHYRAHMTCDACNRLACVKSNCASDCTQEQTQAS
ncbi:MAG: TetR/AcrR family transcriptional regulator, partial [Shewanella sp.]|nr:TetR/AcrR family transcriptional regulator [Shewanella sp.]